MSEKSSGSYLPPEFLHGADYNFDQWLSDPEVLREDLRLMREARVNVVSIGIFSWALLEPEEGVYRFEALDEVMDSLAANGIRAILATPSAAKPAWLSHRYPEVRMMDAQGHREPHRLRHNFCRTSPVYRAKTQAINGRLAQRYRDHPALLMWHVSNEYGATPCHCPLCYGAFRGWLQARYSDLDLLNAAWWTSFWSHTYSSWEQIEPVDESVHGLMLDWARFISDHTVDFFLAECEPLRRITPDVPVTTNFMQPDVGLDYWKFSRHVNVVSWDSYPRWHAQDDRDVAARTAFYHDLHRSYRNAPFLLMESTPSVTNWQGLSRPKRPGMHLLSSLQAIAHGSDSVQYFQWRQGKGGSEKFHGAVVESRGGSDTRVFREVAEVGRTLASLDPRLLAARNEAQVAVVYDFESEWALRNAQLPNDLAKSYQETCASHHRALWRLGMSVDLASGDLDPTPYRLIVVPMLYLLTRSTARRLADYAQAGGVVVTTYLTGLVDEHDLVYEGGIPEPLAGALGISVAETDTFPAGSGPRLAMASDAPLRLTAATGGSDYADVLRTRGAVPLLSYDSEFYRGAPAATWNRCGRGQAIYLGTRLSQAALLQLYGTLGGGLGLRHAPGLPDGVSLVERFAAGRVWSFLMNFTDEVLSLPELEVVEGDSRRRLAQGALELEPYGFRLIESP